LKIGIPPEDAGSSSEDFSAVGRIGPLVWAYRRDIAEEEIDDFVNACVSQSKLTHNNSQVLIITKYIAHVVAKILLGTPPNVALTKVLETREYPATFQDILQRVMASQTQDSLEATKNFGLSCTAVGAFPAALHFVVKYEHDLETALIENVLVGGDSASRALVIGLLLGAYHGDPAIPQRWCDTLAAKDEIIQFTELSLDC